MAQLVQPRLVNPPEGDPGLYLDFRFGRRAMLFDLGDLAPLTPRELLRVSHVFVSHAHMDHVAGFDALLRLRLHRPRPLALTGPPGFLGQVQNRLGAFTWNLLNDSSVDFRLRAGEFDGTRLSAVAEFRARDAFRRRDLPPPALAPGRVLEEDGFAIEAAALDHHVPSLAFALRERQRVNVWRNALEARGLPPGPWIDAAKSAIRAGAPDDHPVEVPGHGALPLGELLGEVFHRAPGQHVAYVTDAADTVENRARIEALARGADQLFIETPFLDADRDTARATAHLTARAAGEIARAAGARRVTGFHHSARYGGETGLLAAELAAAADPEAAPDAAPPEPETPRAAGAEPNWLRRWRRGGITCEAALARFDSLPEVAVAELTGDWRGRELPTGHPLDGLLEGLGWQGKRFGSAEDVDPLVFAGRPLEPALMPLRTALRHPRLARSRLARAAFVLLRPALRARGPAARLAPVHHRGRTSAAMLYDRQPITDHFRRIDARRLLGLMELRGTPPFFFLLERGE
jgi:ribonuclease Z